MRGSLIDSHAHLFMKQFSRDRLQVLEGAEKAGVGAIINVGIDLASSQRAIEMARDYPGLWATVGIHPHYTDGWDDVDELESVASSPGVVALGETGLDFYRNLAPAPVQEEAFRRHLRLAAKIGLPVVVHSRDAHDDTLRVLREEGGVSGVMHCFSGALHHARSTLDMGFYVSVAGPVTYPGASGLREVVKFVPLDRLLIETDCPYLAPQAYRGKRNEPRLVRAIGEFCAGLRNLDVQAFAEAVRENTLRLFSKIDPDTVLKTSKT